MSDAGWRQFHVAETEKYAHVTYFFNGGEEEAYEGETREVVVATEQHARDRAAARIDDVDLAVLEAGQVRALAVAGVDDGDRRRLAAHVDRADQLVPRDPGGPDGGVEDLERRRPAVQQVEPVAVRREDVETMHQRCDRHAADQPEPRPHLEATW